VNTERKGRQLLNITGTSSNPAGPEERRSSGGSDNIERASFAAGCFWGVEAAFRELEGVVKTRVGYTGGRTADPDYEQVCSGTTGHAESVDVWFDPRVVSYSDLLNAFWSMHDPTTRDRQGWDFGSQYRSAIFVHDSEQERLAIASRDAHQPAFARPIVTEISSASTFYDAEDYHQRYFEKHGGAACATSLRN
jgi:peptide-methionine (S)-S-oxide reductase